VGTFDLELDAEDALEADEEAEDASFAP